MVRLLVLAAGLLAGTAAAAQTPPAAPPVDQTVRTEVVKALDENFGKADVNNDGFLSEQEVGSLTARTNQQLLARLDAEFKSLDKDKNDQLSIEEFRAAGAARMAMLPAAALQRLDTNKDGKVNPAEFKALPLAAYDRIDKNKDGKITPEERAAAAR